MAMLALSDQGIPLKLDIEKMLHLAQRGHFINRTLGSGRIILCAEVEDSMS